MKNLAYSVQRIAYSVKKHTLQATRYTLSIKGVSLVELMITLAIFSIIVSMIYSVYNTFLKTATAERKVAKTEIDVVSVSWPLIKEIQSAGFGVPSFSCTPSVYQCACGISVSGNELIIHSTAAGDDEHAGKWAYVTGTTCTIINTSNIPAAQNVVVINNLDRSKLSPSTPPKIAFDGSNFYVSSCDGNYVNNLVYWNPYEAAGDLECYETRYALRDLTSTSPAMCAQGTKILSRSVKHVANTPDYEPMLDCVLDLDYRFGCIKTSTGNLTWQAGTNCGTSKLRLMKVGVVVQSSPRRDSQLPADMSLFEDLSGQSKTVTLSEEQRYYKWRKIEQIISLRNLE